jgi:hypothetical protein
VERRTYVSTAENTSQITLFRETTTADGPPDSATAVHTLEGSTKPVIFLGVAPEKIGSTTDNLILVKGDGEIQCLDGQDLGLKWTSPAAAISKNSSAPDVQNHKIELVSFTDAHTASKGLLKGQQDAFSIFSEEIDVDGFNPTLLVVISSPIHATIHDRTLHVLALPRAGGDLATSQIHSAQALFSVTIPWLHSQLPAKFGELQYDIHVSSGLLYELAGRTLTIYDLTDGTPKIKSQLNIDNVSSFLRLSNTSLMAATNEAVDIYNPTFHSIQASVDLESIQVETVSRKRKLDDEETDGSSKSCKLVAYSPKHNLVHAILGNQLIAFPIEARKDVPGRRRALGLLVDSLGCGVREVADKNAGKLRQIPLNSLSSYIPGSKSVAGMQEKFSNLDHCVAAQDIAGFEAIMAEVLGIRREDTTTSINGVSENEVGSALVSTTTGKTVPTWIWPTARKDYPEVDPRWVQYALSRIFSWSSKNDQPKLLVVFYPHNVVNWLLETGNLNKASIETALKYEARDAESRAIPAGQLVSSLVDVDAEMKTLLSLITHNFLDASELVHAIRIIMESLGVFREDVIADKPLLLTNEEALPAVNGDVEAEIEMEEAEADAALQLAEYRLGDGAGVRDQALSLALAKLHTCPTSSVVHALQSNLSSGEIVSLIYLLRFELAKGAWTSKYQDTDQLDGNEEETGTQDSTIVLISSLINSCIDAVGSGGWLSGDSILIAGDHFQSEELISSLKLEVSAALEGIEEATFLKGLTSEVVRYGEAVQKALPASSKKRKVDSSQEGGKIRVNQAPITLAQVGKDAGLLPFGLKVDQQISMIRVGAGGELQRRSARDIGRLKSRKVGKYSQERIVI